MSGRKLFVASLVAWGLAIAVGAIAHAPLHGDEASYAVLARGDAPDWLYRSRGVVVLARLGIALGGGELAMRAASLVLGFTVVLAAYAAGRAFRDAHTGAWTAAVVAGAHPFVLRGAELLGDLPATAAVLGAIAIVLGELRRDGGPRYRLVLAAPLLAASLYLRYGNAVTIALIALASIGFWWRGVVARPLPVIATAALLGALLAPFVAMSLRDTGSPLGLLEIGSTIAARAADFRGSGLLGYVTDDPFVTYGVLVTPLIVVGLIGACRARTRAHAFLATLAIAQIIALGLTAHAEGRYVLVACALFVVLGVDAVRSWGRPQLALAAVAAAWLSCPIMMGYRQLRVGHDEVDTGAAIAADAAGRPCVVVARAIPQLMWYSGCAGEKLVDTRPLGPLDPARRWYAADAPGLPIDPAALRAGTPVAVYASAWRLLPFDSHVR